MGVLPNAEITVPKVTKDLLIFAPSFSRSPVAPVELARSLSKGNRSNECTATHYCYNSQKTNIIDTQNTEHQKTRSNL